MPMMPCDQDVSRKRFQRSPSLENLDEFSIEHQQQTLLDLSLGKLHQEQAQPIEPCLLKSVLISNAVRALQHHMFTSPSVEVINEVKEEDGEATNFIVNTFNSSDYCFTPSSPIAPQKFPKLDSSSFECSPLTLTQQSTDEGFVHSLIPVANTSSDFLKPDIHPFFSHKCTFVSTTSHCITIENHVAETVTVNGNNSVENKCQLSSSGSEALKCSNEQDSNIDSMDTSLSPLDLKGIDPLLYDFDARSPPMLPSPSDTKVGYFSSCGVAANVTSSLDDNSSIKDMESDPSVLLDEIVNMLIET